MSLKRRWRCGCESILEIPPFEGDGPDCELCNNTAPCTWVIMSACRHATTTGEFYLDRCTALVKECGRGCEWTSRWCFASGLGCAENGDPYFDRPLMVARCPSGKRPACTAAEASELPFVDVCDDGGLLDFIDSGCQCTWPELLGGNPDVADVIARTFVKWRLTALTATTAGLVCTTRDGNRAEFHAANWSCTAESTFTLVSRDAGLQGIPQALCVAPGGGEVKCEDPCDTPEARRICCDFLPACDTGQIELNVTGCQGPVPTQLITVTRHTSSATLPCGPAGRYPATAPCGVFWGEFSLGLSGCDGSSEAKGWDGRAAEMFWCDATNPDNPYQGEVYCYNTFLSCWVFQGLLTITGFVCCPIPRFDALLPALACCCEAPVDCCPCTDGDERIVEVNFNSVSGCSLTGQFSQNSSATGCIFLLDGLNDGDCQVNGGGSIECTTGGSPTLGATTDDGAGGGTTNWSTGMTLTVNSCDPIDWEWSGSQGTVTVVEVP